MHWEKGPFEKVSLVVVVRNYYSGKGTQVLGKLLYYVIEPTCE